MVRRKGCMPVMERNRSNGSILNYRRTQPAYKRERRFLEARVGFEPTNGGFADLSLAPLGYRAESLSIANQPELFGHALLASPPPVPTFSPLERESSLRAKIAPILPV